MAAKVDHSGHRKRLKDRYLKEGIDSFEVHNAVELLLFYGVPLKDTNEIAHSLIDTFGSLRNVLEAPTGELVKVDGIGDNSAILIKLINDISRLSIADHNNNLKTLSTPRLAKIYCKRLYFGVTVEELKIICLDNSGNLVHFETVSTGTVNRTNISMRKIAEIALRHNSVSVILAHNHPRGSAYPSVNDIELTNSIRGLLSQIDVELQDHIIVGENETLSMSETPEFSIML